MKTGQVQLLSVLKACQSYVSNLSQLTRSAAARTPLVGPPELKLPVTSQLSLPQPQLAHQPSPTPSAKEVPYSFGNPCHNLYFHVVGNEPESHEHLNQLLPEAWSHNPLTTLKLIGNLLDNHHLTGKGYDELFYTAAFWLYQNHPKTLAHNVVPIVGSLGAFENILEVLYGIVDVNAKSKRTSREHDCYFEYINLIQEKAGDTGTKRCIAMARNAVDMYERDPNYQLLHERVSDVYAECLKCDIQNLKEYEKQKLDNDNDPKDSEVLELTSAAKWCPSVDSFFDRATLICESIAKKVFPREEFVEGVSVEEEANYVSRVRERLMSEVLEPLRAAIAKGYKDNTRRWQRLTPKSKFVQTDFPNDFNPRVSRSAIVKYLEDVKAGGKSKIEAGAMLPDEIISNVHDHNYGQLAEHQWKAMVEEIFLKEGKWKSCLAVCDVSGRMCGNPMNVSLGLGLLVSELGEEPWKGKVFTFSRNPQLLTIQGDGLKSRCTFMRMMDNQDWDGETDFQKVFDLILNVALNENLKPEQMIKRVYVFTSDQDFDDASGGSWNTDYEAIQRKYKEKGYGDVVPRIVFWDLNDDKYPMALPAEQGVATLAGYSKKFFKFFLDNDGDIGPDHVVEAAISGERYQNLAVVD
ncbi:hypothetical protein ACFX11_039305 [Malus domestica]